MIPWLICAALGAVLILALIDRWSLKQRLEDAEDDAGSARAELENFKRKHCADRLESQRYQMRSWPKRAA